MSDPKPTKACGCWTNPDTGYLEACPQHEAQCMDQMMDREAARAAARGEAQ